MYLLIDIGPLQIPTYTHSWHTLQMPSIIPLQLCRNKQAHLMLHMSRHKSQIFFIIMPQSHLVDKLQCMIIYSKTNINLILIITIKVRSQVHEFQYYNIVLYEQHVNLHQCSRHKILLYNRNVEAHNMTKANQKKIHRKLLNILQFPLNHSWCRCVLG